MGEKSRSSKSLLEAHISQVRALPSGGADREEPLKDFGRSRIDELRTHAYGFSDYRHAFLQWPIS